MDVRPRGSAEACLDAADRTTFMEAVRGAGIDPQVAFEKDTSLIKVNGFKMVFDSGMVLVGNSDDLKERVRIRPDDATRPGVDIDDTIKRLGGR